MEERPRAGRPSAQKARELDNKLLKVAADLFVAKGYAEISIDQIAAAAAVGKQTIYRRYPNKEALYKAAVRRFYVEPVEQLWAEEVKAFKALSRSKSSPLKALNLMARRLLHLVIRPDTGVAYRVLVAEGWRFPDWTSVIVNAAGIWERLIKQQLERARLCGEVPDHNPEHTARVLVGLLTGWILRQTLIYDQILDAEAADRYFDCAWVVFLDGVRRGTIRGEAEC